MGGCQKNLDVVTTQFGNVDGFPVVRVAVGRSARV